MVPQPCVRPSFPFFFQNLFPYYPDVEDLLNIQLATSPTLVSFFLNLQMVLLDVLFFRSSEPE
jgi:hypothetical protein